MSQPIITKESEPMTDREAAVAQFEQWEAETNGDVKRIEAALADAVAALQANSYVVLSQKVARLHRELDEAKRNRESQAGRHLRSLAKTMPAEARQLFDDVVEMRRKLTMGCDPFENGEVTIDYRRKVEDFGARFMLIETRVRDLPHNPHPAAEVKAIRAAIEELRTAKRKRPAAQPAANRPDRVPGRAFTTLAGVN